MESDDSEDDAMNVQEELRQLRTEIDKAVTFAESDVPIGFVARVTVPTDEFPGGVDIVPVRHTMPSSVSLGAPISAVNFSLETAEESFVELEEKSELSQLDVLFMESEEVEFPPSINLRETAPVVGCGAPPFGLRPNFLMLACRMGLLCFGIAGVTAGLGDVIDNSDGNYVTEDPVKW
ncbi:hypothetical protein CYMTET_21301 [Cymbomonas tetramitiformis]|uniref:Uncharacterized protein n=1 Tax=Cymbomonas tetramitiformis TaxID=36881 RepID=A0AAE0G2S6_9CHLO|nr:hypothetical protein CYMTET_21301 [Cymbomonas tetramitiformis]